MSKRINDLSSPFTVWRKRFRDAFVGPLAALSDRQKFWIGFTFLCIATTFFIHNPFWHRDADQNYKIDDVVRESIISPADIYYVDEEATERNRQIMKDAVIPIFTYEPKRADEAVQNFRASWEMLQREPDPNRNTNRSNSNNKVESQTPTQAATGMRNLFESRQFSSNELDAISRVLRENAGGDIYDDRDRANLEGQITIVDRQKPTDSRQALNPAATMTSLSESRKGLADGLRQIKSLSDKEAAAFTDVLSPLIQPSVIFDATATENERRLNAESVPVETISLKRSQKIADQGVKVNQQILSEIEAIRSYSSANRQLNRFFGLLVLISLLFWAAWKYIEHRGIVTRLSMSEVRTFALFGFIVVVQSAMMAAFFRIADFTASQNGNAPYSDPGLWAFAIPFAFGSLLMNLLADRRTALFTGIFTSLVAGLMAPHGLEFVIYALIASSVAVYGIGRYRSRQTVTIAGALVGGVTQSGCGRHSLPIRSSRSF